MLADVFGTHNWRHFWSVLTIGMALSLTGTAAHAAFPTAAVAQCTKGLKNVQLSRAQAIRVLAKDKAYTQGLLFSGGALYESTGLYGHSSLRRIDVTSSMSRIIRKLPPNIFAEGIAVVDHEIYQLTFKQDVMFKYSGEGSSVFRLKGEAWGSTQLDNQLVISDGSAKLKFINPATLKTVREITVHRGDEKFSSLNELESAHGYVLANIFGSDWIALINPENGCVEGSIDVSLLRTPDTKDPAGAQCSSRKCVPADFATNGIAYDAANDELYLTGKNWPYIFVFKFPVL